MSDEVKRGRQRKRLKAKRQADQRRELRQLVRAGQVRITDSYGKEHQLYLLDLEDWADLEEFQAEKNGSPGMVRSVVFLLWLMMRKHGLSEEEIDRGEWAYTESQVGRMFTVDDLQNDELIEAIKKVLSASGLDADTDPRMAGFGAGLLGPKS